MDSDGARRARDRFLAWLLTGPLGRLAAFCGDLAAAWLHWAAAKVRRP